MMLVVLCVIMTTWLVIAGFLYIMVKCSVKGRAEKLLGKALLIIALCWGIVMVVSGVVFIPGNMNNQSTTTNNLIGIERAKQIALNEVPGGEVVYLREDKDDGRIIYEGKIIEGHIKYEFDIDAYSGAILDWDKDHIYD